MNRRNPCIDKECPDYVVGMCSVCGLVVGDINTYVPHPPARGIWVNGEPPKGKE